ncbi:MAG TPA: porin family protein [Ohtaekwangia sp.]
MKVTLVTVIAVLMMIGAAHAQPVNIGIKGGLNVFNIKGDNDESFDPRTSFHLGLLGHIHLAEDFALQPEVVYSSQGAKYGDDLKLQLDYINIPILFQYMFDNGFRLQAGPQAGILVGAKADGEDVKDGFETLDLGLGIGASYVNPATSFGVDVRYNLGLSNINDNDDVDSFNRGFQLGVFYLFRHRSN